MIALAATFDPRGEIPRLQRFYPLLQAAYGAIVFSLASHTSAEDLQAVMALPDAQVFLNVHWGRGRYAALEAALKTEAKAIHYNDLDRLLRWIETREDEWRRTVKLVSQADCLIIGRTVAAYNTHPRALIETEAISNTVISEIIGQPMDFSAGSKGFSRAAAEFLMRHAKPEDAMGADAEWPILLKRGGFGVAYVEVDGLDWETADRYRDTAADAETQRRLAAEVDADARHWQHRVSVAMEIVRVAYEAAGRVLET